MNVGIVTIYDLLNYGNRLQNYAVTKLVKDMGGTPETLIIDEYGIKEFVKKHFLKIEYRHWNVRQESKDFFNRLDEKTKLKYQKFKRFTNEYIPTNRFSGNRISLKHIDAKYDFFIAGSDQIWNPYSGHCKDWEFLSFANPKKRIYLAASFGISSLPDRLSKKYKHYFEETSNISVREKNGVDIIGKMTNNKVEVLIDPTLMLSKEEWIEIAKKPQNFNEKPYILTYFLGKKSEETSGKLEEIAKEKGCCIVDMFDVNQDTYTAGPSEFLYLISRAKLVVTDSFHACVFSFLFGIPFLVYARDGKQEMMSRIDTLLEKFSLQRKYAGNNLENNIWEHDYQIGYNQLEYERKVAIDYLRKSLMVL